MADLSTFLEISQNVPNTRKAHICHHSGGGGVIITRSLVVKNRNWSKYRYKNKDAFSCSVDSAIRCTLTLYQGY